MRASLNSKLTWRKPLFYCLLIGLLSAMSHAGTLVPSGAERSGQTVADGFGVRVSNAKVSLQDGHYMLSAHMNYRLSARAKEALQNGVPLYWDIHIKTLRIRDYLWDKTLESRIIRYRIQYHALLNMYRVKREGGDELNNFSTLSAALGSMSTISGFRVMEKAIHRPEQRYAVAIKVTLDRDALPLPLRPIAYADPQWYLSSDWTLWPLTK